MALQNPIDLNSHIAKRMKEMGFADYHIEAIKVVGTITDNAIPLVVYAYNEFWFLVATEVPASLRIVSDTEMFADTTSYSAYNIFPLAEFSGCIEIYQTIPASPNVRLEFVRAIPNSKA